MKKPETPPNGRIEVSESEKLLSWIQDKSRKERILEVEKEYPYWETVKYKFKDQNIDPSLLWKFIKLQRESTANHLNLSTVNGFNFKYNITGKTLRRLHEFDLNLGGLLGGNPLIPEKQKDRFLISSIMEEAIASSQLEGAVTTREVAKDMLRTKRKPENHSEKMILNNYLTIQEILTLKDEPLTIDIIKKIQKIISKNTLDKPDYEGSFRTNNEVKVVDITGEVFYDPPSFEQVDELMNSFCNFANSKDEKDFIHPIVRGIILHFLIGYIHPFADGNGRTARAIFYWYLLSKGYWLIEYLSISRIIIKSPAQYARAYLYSEYDENDLTYFIDFNLKSMHLALKSLKEYIARKVNDKRDLFSLIKNEDVNERQAEIIRWLVNESDLLLSVNEVQSRFATSYQTARTDLLKLESLKYLESKFTGKKFVYFKSPDFSAKLSNLRFE